MVATARMVLLLHTLRDGSSHFDWLIERPGVPGRVEHRLLSLRVHQRIDRPAARAAAFVAEVMPDHRAWYLDHEGEITGGRGVVRCMARGTVRFALSDTERLVVRSAFAGRRACVYVGTPMGSAGEQWLVRRRFV